MEKKPETRKVIGVTGGFCSGKTSLSRYLSLLGARVIDADVISRHLLEKDKNTKRDIFRKFGKDVFDGNKVNRKRLAEIVFSDKKLLKALGRILHPKIINIIKKEIKCSRKQTVVIDAPLLIESKLNRACDFVILVVSGMKSRLKRAEKKGISVAQAKKRISAQTPDKKRVRFADFIIKNNGDLKKLKKKVAKLWKKMS